MDFEVPENLIAQFPTEPRDECRLMILDQKSHKIEHKVFKNILELFNKGDLLVFNNTRVIKARIFAQKSTGGKVEILLLKEISNNIWEALISGKKIKEGLEIFLEDKKVLIQKHINKSKFLIQFFGVKDILSYTEKNGNIPLPPYIKREANKKDEEMYQTVFNENLGSVASPTASLHFTKDLLSKLKKKGVNSAYLTLNVGYGTFAPLEDINSHKMHTEEYFVPLKLEKIIKETKLRGNKIIAVGTTVVRTLESAFDKNLNLIKASGETNLFIKENYNFKVPDIIITNFHHHSTTLIHLVGAFAGYDFIEKAYKTAIKNKYKMLSYGDAMIIL